MRHFVDVIHIDVDKCAHGEWSDAMMADYGLLPIDRYHLIGTLEIDMDARVTVPEILNRAYMATQNIEESWTYLAGMNPDPEQSERSTSPGDIFRVHGKLYRVNRMGFREITVPEHVQALTAAFPPVDRRPGVSE